MLATLGLWTEAHLGPSAVSIIDVVSEAKGLRPRILLSDFGFLWSGLVLTASKIGLDVFSGVKAAWAILAN